MSIDRGMDEKLWYIYTMEFYSVINRNKTGHLQWCRRTQSAIQSEGSQKEEVRCNILKHICGIQKEWCRGTYSQGRSRDTDEQSESVDAGGKERVGWAERAALTDSPPRVPRQLVGSCWRPREPGSATAWGWDGGDSRGRGRVCTYSWFTLSFRRSEHNTVKELSANKNK